MFFYTLAEELQSHLLVPPMTCRLQSTSQVVLNSKLKWHVQKPVCPRNFENSVEFSFFFLLHASTSTCTPSHLAPKFFSTRIPAPSLPPINISEIFKPRIKSSSFLVCLQITSIIYPSHLIFYYSNFKCSYASFEQYKDTVISNVLQHEI